MVEWSPGDMNQNDLQHSDTSENACHNVMSCDVIIASREQRQFTGIIDKVQ